MKSIQRKLLTSAVTAFLLLLPGCVELTGQRISWFYDQAKDELKLLIFYDGIHDSGSAQYGAGTEQIPEFVRNGDVMFADWPSHFSKENARKGLTKPDLASDEMAMNHLFLRVKTMPIGFYREPDARIGGAQLVTIPNATGFLRELNRVINLCILEEKARDPENHPRTARRWRTAAADGHAWVTLHGHSFRVVVPVDPQEWQYVKSSFLQWVSEPAIKGGESADAYSWGRSIIQGIASVPISYIESGNRVTFVLGRPERPTTLRLPLYASYEPGLEAVVREAVKVDLDEEIANNLLEHHSKQPPGISAILAWGPPEERVRGLIKVAESGDALRKESAKEMLDTWAKRWNRVHVLPRAPESLENDGSANAWAVWYEAMKQYPFAVEEKNPDKQPTATQPTATQPTATQP